ncbi:MAG: hypothetical protein JSS82_20040 [Bacteroidetes bacterium]|nr:hypothetical protein [Bacteroidota bacterium]
MAYQLPPRQHIASRRLTATLIGIYALIILLILLLSTESNGNISTDRKSFSRSTSIHSTGNTSAQSTYSN